jgi:type IV secretory pathway component VirB8
MARLRNKILEKLASEGRISFMSADEEYNIYQSTHERMIQYNRVLSKKAYSSHVLANETILNS